MNKICLLSANTACNENEIKLPLKNLNYISPDNFYKRKKLFL